MNRMVTGESMPRRKGTSAKAHGGNAEHQREVYHGSGAHRRETMLAQIVATRQRSPSAAARRQGRPRPIASRRILLAVILIAVLAFSAAFRPEARFAPAMVAGWR